MSTVSLMIHFDGRLFQVLAAATQNARSPTVWRRLWYGKIQWRRRTQTLSTQYEVM